MNFFSKACFSGKLFQEGKRSMEGLKRKLLAGFLSMVLVLSLFLSGSVYAEELDEGPAVSVEADEADLETEEMLPSPVWPRMCM